MALMEYGPKWRKLRKAMSIFNSPSEVKKFAKVESASPWTDAEVCPERVRRRVRGEQADGRFKNWRVRLCCGSIYVSLRNIICII